MPPNTASPPICEKAPPWYDVIIAGGGLAGLIMCYRAVKGRPPGIGAGEEAYPFHKVCGEYVSNEVLAYLQSLGFDPFAYGAARISKLRVSAPSGRELRVPLKMGGFGLSRYVMDDALQQLAAYYGAKVISGERVTDVALKGGIFTVDTSGGGRYDSMLVVGSWGKRAMLDKKLDRDFLAATPATWPSSTTSALIILLTRWAWTTFPAATAASQG